MKLLTSIISRIKNWRWRQTSRIRKAYHIQAKLYESINGSTLSKQDRKTLGNDCFELVYGETDFYTLAAILGDIHPSENSIFYDLGSGTGRVCISAALLYPLQKIYGIECLPSLYQCSVAQLKELQKYPDLPENFQPNTIQFIQADFLEQDISEADIILVNGTGFFGESKQHLLEKLSEAKSQSYIISISKSLPEDTFILQNVKLWPMSWGMSLIYVYRKR